MNTVNTKRYKPRDFRASTPEWKRKKETFIGKILYRPLSYVISSVLANFGVKANSVSYFSMLVSIVGCTMFVFNNHVCHIIGALIFIIWAILDCVDGDMARTIGKQPFGDFADAISCYILQGLMCTTMGIAVFYTGGLLVEPSNIWIVLAGSLASTANCLMRLIYQKYLSAEKDLVDIGIVKKTEDVWKDKDKAYSFKVKFKETMGVGGIFPFIVLIAVIYNALDIVLLYCLALYGLAFLYTSYGYVKKAITIAKQYEKEGLHQLDNEQ